MATESNEPVASTEQTAPPITPAHAWAKITPYAQIVLQVLIFLVAYFMLAPLLAAQKALGGAIPADPFDILAPFRKPTV